MNSKRVFFVLIGVLVLLFAGLLGSAYGVSQLLHQKAQHLVGLKLQSAVLQNQQTGLIKAKKEVKDYSELNSIAEAIVPQDKDQAEAVREISNLAGASGITQLSSVTFPQSTLGGITGASSSNATAIGQQSPTTTAVPATSSGLTQLTKVPSISGLYQLPITIQQASDNPVYYSQFINFLSLLEQNRRTAQVSGITIQPDSKNPSLIGFSLTINEFIRP